jgi:3-hydroxybutyryl-CoA dehydratase
MAATTKYFEDFQVGETFQIPAKTITDAHFVFFAGMTGDHHPIHYDDEYAKTTRFGKRVAHGLLLTALTAVGASTLSSVLEGSMVALVEQSARFLKPVLIGDTITPELEVSRVVPQ